MVPLLALVAEIHITLVKNPDGTPVIFDKERAFAERVKIAHDCSAVLAAALDELKALGEGLPSGGKHPGIEHTCFVVGVSRSSIDPPFSPSDRDPSAAPYNVPDQHNYGKDRKARGQHGERDTRKPHMAET